MYSRGGYQEIPLRFHLRDEVSQLELEAASGQPEIHHFPCPLAQSEFKLNVVQQYVTERRASAKNITIAAFVQSNFTSEMS
jgi:hypothetical protein